MEYKKCVKTSSLTIVLVPKNNNINYYYNAIKLNVYSKSLNSH